MVSEPERAQRWRRLRDEMAKTGHEVLLIAGREGMFGRGYLRYLSDWHMWGGTGFVVFPVHAEPSLILGSNSQARWARRIDWIQDVRVGMHGPVPETIGVLSRLGVAGRLGVVGMGRLMGYNDIRALQEGLPGVSLVDAEDVMERVRAIKSAEEVANLPESSRVVAEAMRAFKRALAPGKTEREVVSEAWRVAREGGVLDGIAHITHDDPAFIRAITTPKRGIGAATLERLGGIAGSRHESLFGQPSRPRPRMLTNWRTIRARINELERLERGRDRGEFDRLTKKEILIIDRQIERLNMLLSGVRSLTQVPNLLFVVDVHREFTAIHEANLLNIPFVAMVDTNCDPTLIHFPIPGNDDALRAIKLFAGRIADAVIAGRGLREARGAEAAALAAEKGDTSGSEGEAPRRPRARPVPSATAPSG